MAKQAEIKQELGDRANVSNISKRSAELWKNLSKEERAVWDKQAAQDKARYNMEKEAYTGPWQIPWKRQKKDPSAPKRPMRYVAVACANDMADTHPQGTFVLQCILVLLAKQTCRAEKGSPRQEEHRNLWIAGSNVAKHVGGRAGSPC